MSDPKTSPVITDDLMASIESRIQQYRRRIDQTLSFNKTSIMDVLDQASITTIVVRFDGYGDSGQIEDVEVDGQVATLPHVPVAYKAVDHNESEPEQKMIHLQRAIEDIVYQLLEVEHAGWENNDGAYGDITFDVVSRTITLDFNERYTMSNNTTHSY